MLTVLALASSLWFAGADAGARPLPPGAMVTSSNIKLADSLVADVAINIFGTSMDLGSTDWAISRGCVEANPLIQRVEGRVAGKLALSGFRLTMSYLLRSRGHKKAADIFRWTGFATDVALTANNIACGIRKGKNK